MNLDIVPFSKMILANCSISLISRIPGNRRKGSKKLRKHRGRQFEIERCNGIFNDSALSFSCVTQFYLLIFKIKFIRAILVIKPM